MQTIARDGQSPSAVGTAVRRPRTQLTIWVLVALDVLALLVATTVAAVLATWFAGIPLHIPPGHWALLLLALPMTYALADLYPGAGVSPVDEMRTQVTIITTFALVILVAVLVGLGSDLNEIVPLIAGWLTALVFTTGFRLIARELFARKAWWGVAAAVIGAGKTAHVVVDRLQRRPLLNLKVVACLDDDPAKWGRSVGSLVIEGPIEQAAHALRDTNVDYVIVAMPGLEPSRLSILVQKLGTTFGKVVVVPNAFGMTSVGVGTRDSGGIVSLYVRGHLSLRRNRVLKRVLDILMLIPLGVLGLPVVAVCVLLVLVFSPGNPFYAQVREGFGARRFLVWKLRTMHRDADQILAQHLDHHPEARAEWQTHFKLARDPRIIPVIGHVLRRLSLDELPQLWNIARGQLSLVGPRPFPYYHLEAFGDEFRALRRSVPPGLTGYWQVTARATADIDAQIELDTYYINNWSPWIDLYILARTPWAILFGDGAY